ncbi:hypothetical protein CQ14_09550 [Bradyrhizobium lablabi]|uniref:Uncharacterized protein n=1 Tax=Bradyrhizobium lablabi TaxID=722472 RepID=A0A0R3MYX8_9BRAD|nr:hypothetical protein [Bradyrhizobium lablabi]KRR25252.1 hypothetical protein CQ14_09550 [Bradyrhizobium lablabi]
MKIAPSILGALMAFVATAAMAQSPATPKKPPPPSENVPALGKSKSVGMCVGCEKPFDFPAHKQLLEGLADNPYIGELRMALYVQDIRHQFESKAHFDNCHFEGAQTYLMSLIEEAGRHASDALAAKNRGDTGAMTSAAKAAFFSPGQALHAVQDFYAHTNYAELQAPKVKEAGEIPVIAPWRKADQDKIADLRKAGLVSGYVFWGFPQDCPAGTISHRNLAKDSADTVSGKRLIPHLNNLSQFRLAVFLARQASLQLMEDAFQRWPVLKELNGPNVAFEILLDRRGL